MWWFITDCLLVQGKWNHLNTTWLLMEIWQASEISHSKSILDNFQHQYLSELLVNLYNYHLMVKSMSCCCACGSWLFQIQSHTYVCNWRQHKLSVHSFNMYIWYIPLWNFELFNHSPLVVVVIGRPVHRITSIASSCLRYKIRIHILYVFCLNHSLVSASRPA